MKENNLPDSIAFSIIVPLYNESKNIDEFYKRTADVMDGLKEPFEIVFINDGSSDDSFERLSALQEKDTRIKIIDLSRNFGKEIALSAGIDYDIQPAGNLKSMFFGREGLFLATLQGRGYVYLQSLPFSRLADRIIQHAPTVSGSDKGEGSALGGIGRLLDGD